MVNLPIKMGLNTLENLKKVHVMVKALLNIPMAISTLGNLRIIYITKEPWNCQMAQNMLVNLKY